MKKYFKKVALFVAAIVATTALCTLTNPNYCNVPHSTVITYKQIKGLKKAKKGETKTVNLRDLAKIKFKVTKSGRLSVVKYYGLLEPDKHDNDFYMGTAAYGYDIERVKSKAFYKSKDIGCFCIFNPKAKQKSYIEKSAFEKSGLHHLMLQGKVTIEPNAFKNINKDLSVHLNGIEGNTDFSSHPVLKKNCFKNTKVNMDVEVDNDEDVRWITPDEATQMIIPYISNIGCKVGSTALFRYNNGMRQVTLYYTSKGWEVTETDED